MDVATLFQDLLGAAKASFAKDWKKAKDYAEPELRRLAASLVDIGELALAGKVNEQQAKAMLRIHRSAVETVLLTVKGLGILAVENAINAALGAVKKAVNKAVGFALL